MKADPFRRTTRSCKNHYYFVDKRVLLHLLRCAIKEADNSTRWYVTPPSNKVILGMLTFVYFRPRARIYTSGNFVTFSLFFLSGRHRLNLEIFCARRKNLVCMIKLTGEHRRVYVYVCECSQSSKFFYRRHLSSFMHVQLFLWYLLISSLNRGNLYDT